MKKKNSGLVVIILTVLIIGSLFLILINTGSHVASFGEPGQILVSIAIVWVIVKVIKWLVRAHRGY